MNSVDPNTVVSPKKRWHLDEVLYVDEEDGWSAANGRWDNGDVLAIRWNGDKDQPLGHPQSRGKPTWFIVPGALESVLRKKIARLSKT